MLLICMDRLVVSLFLDFFFFFNDTATTEIYTLSLHDALPISRRTGRARWRTGPRSGRRRPSASHGKDGSCPLLARGHRGTLRPRPKQAPPRWTNGPAHPISGANFQGFPRGFYGSSASARDRADRLSRRRKD